MLYCFLLLETKNTCNEKLEISLLPTSAIYFHFSDSFPHISGRLNFEDRKFCKTSRKSQNQHKL